jgi:hypothetical protein
MIWRMNEKELFEMLLRIALAVEAIAEVQNPKFKAGAGSIHQGSGINALSKSA